MSTFQAIENDLPKVRALIEREHGADFARALDEVPGIVLGIMTDVFEEITKPLVRRGTARDWVMVPLDRMIWHWGQRNGGTIGAREWELFEVRNAVNGLPMTPPEGMEGARLRARSLRRAKVAMDEADGLDDLTPRQEPSPAPQEPRQEPSSQELVVPPPAPTSSVWKALVAAAERDMAREDMLRLAWRLNAEPEHVDLAVRHVELRNSATPSRPGLSPRTRNALAWLGNGNHATHLMRIRDSRSGKSALEELRALGFIDDKNHVLPAGEAYLEAL